MSPWLERLSGPGPALEQALALYREAIPPRERKPDAAIAGMAHSPDHQLLVLRDDADEVIAFSVWLAPRGADCGVLEYLCVRPDQRGRGLGAELFGLGLAAVRADGPRNLMIEVESEREDTPERALRLRRKQFYRRLGCRQVRDIEYILALDGDGPAPWLDILVAAEPSLEVLSREHLRGWLVHMYVDGYGQRPDDPRIDAILASTPDPVVLS